MFNLFHGVFIIVISFLLLIIISKNIWGFRTKLRFFNFIFWLHRFSYTWLIISYFAFQSWYSRFELSLWHDALLFARGFITLWFLRFGLAINATITINTIGCSSSLVRVPPSFISFLNLLNISKNTQFNNFFEFFFVLSFELLYVYLLSRLKFKF